MEEFKEWDPMVDDYKSPAFNTYTEGPGADMDESLQPANLSNSQIRRPVKIHVRNLPSGITEKGVCNLFLSIGKPISVYLHHNSSFAIVEFAKPREAELALRDLDNEPPYFLKVSYAREREPVNKDQYESNSNDDQWVFDSKPVEKRQKIMRDNVIKHGQKIFDHVIKKPEPLPGILDYRGDPHYFNFIKNEFNGSVGFYQFTVDINVSSDMECDTDMECVSRGRGFRMMGNTDRFVGKETSFSSGSGIWTKKFLSTNECYNCQAKTIKMCNYCRVPFCSNVCLKALNHDCAKEKLLTEDVGLPVKDKWEYVIPQSLNFTERNVDLGTSVLENFNEQTSGFFKLYYGYGSIFFGSVIPSGKSDYSAISTLRTSRQNIEDASEGDRVLIPDELEVGRRGVILSKGNAFYRVALIDIAEVLTVDKIYPMPEEVQEINHFGCQLVITEEIDDKFLANSRGNKGTQIKFEVTGPCKSGEWPVVLRNIIRNKIVAKGILKKWTPLLDLECITLKAGGAVVISSYVSARTMYIRRDDEDWREKFTLLNNEVAHCALRSENLTDPPVIGEIYAARYMNDNGYYRAVVKSVKEEKIQIVFIDFGNEQWVKKEHLKPLPDSLKRVPCFAVKVFLKDVPKKSSKEAVSYLNELTAKSVELLLNYDDCIVNGVELREVGTGVRSNNRLIEDLTPSWKKDPNYQSPLGRIIFKKHIRNLKFPGDTKQELYVTCIDPEIFSTSGVFWAVPNLPDFISYIYGEFKEKMEEYAESFDNGSYLPRKNELCLALHEGEWLRAVCVEQEGTTCYLLFVDYGYKGAVETNAVRKMKEDFIEAPSLAVPCMILGFEKWKNEPELEKQVTNYLNKFFEMKLTDVNIVKVEEDINVVQIPHVDRILNPACPKEMLDLIESIKDF